MMMEIEEEMGPPVVDWAEHYRRQKNRILFGMGHEDGDEGQDEDAENYEALGYGGMPSYS